MEKFFAFTCVVLFTVSATASERTEVNNKGEVRVVTDYDNIDVWRGITKEEAAAFARPGKEIPTDLRLSGSVRYGFFYTIPVSKYTKVVAFADNRIQALEKTGVVRGEPEFAVYVVLCLISVILMLISNIVMWRAREDFAFAAAAAVAAVVAVAAAAVVVAAAAVAAVAVVAAAVAAVAAVAVDMRNKSVYVACVVVFYLAMTAALFI